MFYKRLKSNGSYYTVDASTCKVVTNTGVNILDVSNIDVSIYSNSQSFVLKNLYKSVVREDYANFFQERSLPFLDKVLNNKKVILGIANTYDYSVTHGFVIVDINIMDIKTSVISRLPLLVLESGYATFFYNDNIVLEKVKTYPVCGGRLHKNSGFKDYDFLKDSCVYLKYGVNGKTIFIRVTDEENLVDMCHYWII